MKGKELEIAPHGTAMTQGFHSFKTPVRIDSFQPHGHARLVGMTALPLAPCISPGLVSAHVRAAAIIDNLNMMHDVLADVLMHPKVADVRAAIDEVIVQFTDPRYRIVEVDDWITMALRHSIFQQGGPALGTMTANERNSSGHSQHSRGARAMPPRGMQ